MLTNRIYILNNGVRGKKINSTLVNFSLNSTLVIN